MKRLLTTTTALSVALALMPPMPVTAQDAVCDPAVDATCAPVANGKGGDDAEARAKAEAAAAAQAQAEADAAAATKAAEGAAAAQAQAEAEAAAAEAAAQAATQAEADAAAAAQAQADADAAAAAQAEADAAAAAQAQADADAAAAAQAQVDADAAALQAQAEAEAAAKLQAQQEAAAQAEADAAAAKAAADAAIAAQPDAGKGGDTQATDDAAAQAAADAAAKQAADEAAAAAAADAAATKGKGGTAATDTPVLPDETVAPPPADTAVLPDETVAPQPTDTPAEGSKGAAVVTETPAAPTEDPAAGLATTEDTAATPTAPVDAPVPEETAVEALNSVLEAPADGDAAGATTAAAAAAALVTGVGKGGAIPVDAPPPADATVTTQTVTKDDARSSDEEFKTAPVQVGRNKKSGLSDLEKVGLVALGALVVGAIINEGNKRDQREVVSNTGDRVVVQRPDGTYQVYKDDDAILRRPGSTVRTENYRDGSTRTIVEKADGTQIVTIRDASGRVLRRATYDRDGRERLLIDDLEPERPVVLRDLPRPRADRVSISTSDSDAALKARLAAREAEAVGRGFSLRQIREIAEVRAFAATIDVTNITFDSGSAAINATEAENLADLGGLIDQLLKANPGEIFLIEGHTDAVGSGAANLALSDRRAESVALALTEYFDVPPENLVVQGYGEQELRIDTDASERANRRVAVRIITPLMEVASN